MAWCASLLCLCFPGMPPDAARRHRCRRPVYAFGRARFGRVSRQHSQRSGCRGPVGRPGILGRAWWRAARALRRSSRTGRVAGRLGLRGVRVGDAPGAAGSGRTSFPRRPARLSPVHSPASGRARRQGSRTGSPSVAGSAALTTVGVRRHASRGRLHGVPRWSIHSSRGFQSGMKDGKTRDCTSIARTSLMGTQIYERSISEPSGVLTAR